MHWILASCTLRMPPAAQWVYLFRFSHVLRANQKEPSQWVPSLWDRPICGSTFERCLGWLRKLHRKVKCSWPSSYRSRWNTKSVISQKNGFYSRGTFPILSRDPSFQKTSRNPGKTAGVLKERCLKIMGNQPLELWLTMDIREMVRKPPWCEMKIWPGSIWTVSTIEFRVRSQF